MKKFIISLAAMIAAVSAFAQEETVAVENVSEEVKVKANDGWFISIGGGANLSIEGTGTKSTSGTGWAPALTVDFGKWFTPSVGLALRYDGLKLKNSVYFPDGINYNTATVAFLWNLINTFEPYQPERVVNVVLYPFAGAAFGKAATFTAGAGIQLPIRLGNVVSLVPDVKCNYLSDKIYSKTSTGGNAAIETTLAIRFRF